MLVQFRFKNFRSFNQETVLSFQAAPLDRNKYQVRQAGSVKLLPVAVLFGSAGSGKSNVLKAFAFMTDCVRGCLCDDPSRSRVLQNFRFAPAGDSDNSPSEFEVWFVPSDDEKQRLFHYGFSLCGKSIQREWLKIKARTARTEQTIFERTADSLQMSSKITGDARQVLEEALKPDILLVSLGGIGNVPVLCTVTQWFKTVLFYYGSDLRQEMDYLAETARIMAEDESLSAEFSRYLNAFETSAKGVEIDQETGKQGIQNPLSLLHLVEQYGDQSFSYPLSEASSGLRKLAALYLPLRKVLNTGGLLVADDLNTSLHPLLVRRLLQIFADPESNPKNAQLLASLQDVWQLDHPLLRRDEIWFVNKKGTSSTLCSLYDFTDAEGKKIRDDESFLKNYMNGKYGAVPAFEDPCLPSLNNKSGNDRRE